MSDKIIGIHIDSNIDVLEQEVIKVTKAGGKIIQLFTNVMSKTAKRKYDELNVLLKYNNLKCIVHASYTINLAQNWTYHSWWIKQFIMEINMAENIGAIGIVIHLGKQLDLSYEEAINNMYMSLIHVNSQIGGKNIKILIETSSGQGSEMCYDINELAKFYKKFSKNNNTDIQKRFGICLDTCHIFSAGYDISTKSKFEEYAKTFDELIGIEHIKLIHLNDSKKDVGSHVDRHENIGEGFIGKESLLIITEFFSRLNVPLILETPEKNILNDLKTILK